MRDERFVIWFQPRFDINTGKFCGSEALVRFFDDDGIIITPMDFIPEIEQMETVHLIDFYVFRRVCEYISEWHKAGKKVKPISVNMSHRTMLKQSFVENLMNILYTNDVPKELVVIEVTEERETGGLSDVAEVLKDLKKHGFRIAIDNFGSKYADLYLIADLKFDILKLDGDMIYKMRTDRKASYLARSIVDICHEENIKIVAEDVESDEEMNILRDISCDEVQGYLFDKPMSWDKFEEKYL
ncbi:MAG: EAL domain-containing protein [Oscillospiraceae bacterium]|nr:EAL domain-containing protein [Oscillospiraceae bacterium]